MHRHVVARNGRGAPVGMNKKELQYLEQVLTRCTPLDSKLAKALALVRKDIAAYEARRGQLRDQYDADLRDLHSGSL
jgi:hypothetical protein